jgi:SAM-dependent methyltransferase
LPAISLLSPHEIKRVGEQWQVKRFLKHAWNKIILRSQGLASEMQAAGKDESFSPDVTPEAYKQAAINYPKQLPPDNRYYLYIKPFDSAKDKSYSAQFFHRFASIIEILALPQRSKILDVACGPGWLSEFLARSGYAVTGIDICPDMIEVARERVETIKFGPNAGQPLKARFQVADPEVVGLGTDIYHAAIFYDCLHHFTDPQAVLQNIFQVLTPGGKLYIQEGVKPAPGSECEKILLEEMRRFGTLEKPFSQIELFDLLKHAGFVAIQAFEAINLIVKRKGKAIFPRLADVPVPMTNTILARKPGGSFDSRFPNVLKANLRVVGGAPPRAVDAGTIVELSVALENAGDSLWLSRQNPDGGFVTLGTKLLNAKKRVISDVLERTALPDDVAPGQTITVIHRFTTPAQPGNYWIKLDLVDEQVIWFEQEGSVTLEFPIQVRALK